MAWISRANRGRPLSAAAGRSVRKLQAVVFDMDGVIIDSHPAHRQAWQTFLDSLGKRVTLKDLEFILDEFLMPSNSTLI